MRRPRPRSRVERPSTSDPMYAVFVPSKTVQFTGAIQIVAGAVLAVLVASAVGSDRWPASLLVAPIAVLLSVRGGRQFRCRIEIGSHGIVVRRATRWVGFRWDEVAGFLVEPYAYRSWKYWPVGVLVPKAGRPVDLIALASEWRDEVLADVARLETARARATGTSLRRSVEWYG